MQVLLQVLVSLTQYTCRNVFCVFCFFENEYIEYRKTKTSNLRVGKSAKILLMCVLQTDFIIG